MKKRLLGVLLFAIAISVSVCGQELPKGGLLGDINQSGTYSSVDWTEGGRGIAGLLGDGVAEILDLNGNGRATATDWTAVGNLAAGIPFAIPGRDIRLAYPSAKRPAGSPLLKKWGYPVVWLRKPEVGEATASLVNAGGTVVYQTAMQLNNNGTFTLNVPDVATGTYSLVLSGKRKNGEVATGDSVQIEIKDQISTGTGLSRAATSPTQGVAGTSGVLAVFEGNLNRDGEIYVLSIGARVKNSDGSEAPGAGFISGFEIRDGVTGALLSGSGPWIPPGAEGTPATTGFTLNSVKTFVPTTAVDLHRPIQILILGTVPSQGGVMIPRLDEILILPASGNLFQIEALIYDGLTTEVSIISPVGPQSLRRPSRVGREK